MAAESYKHRRYISGKESMAFVLFSSSKGFNIEGYKTNFVLKVLHLDMAWASIIGLVNGIWDVINDGLLGALIDKTYTRWGKFRPYLFAFSTCGTLLMLLSWLSPYFFPYNPVDPKKIIFWLLLAMIYDIFGTVKDISENGMVASLSPNPDDRVRLYTRAEVIGAIWESIPEFLMGFLYDMYKDDPAKLKTTFGVMGSATVIVGGILGLFFCLYGRERISQAVEKHNYREGIKTILTNRPLRIALLSEIFGGFSAETWEFIYYPEVLGSITLRNVIRLPGAPLSFLSYTYIAKARERFSIKTLWIVGSHLKDWCSLAIFIVGSFGGIYKKAPARLGLGTFLSPMALLLMVRNLLYMGTLSLNKIPPREILLDSIDYAEWKNGFRTEGLTIATRAMISKIVRNVINSLTPMILRLTGYVPNALVQTDRAKYAIFAMSFGATAFMGMLAMIPKLFYDLTGEKRAQMFEELKEIRRLRQLEYDKLNEAERSTT